MDTIILIDGNSLINRAFYALPPLNNAEGQPTQAVYGFINMLLKLLEIYRPDYMAVTFDLPAPTFRHLRYDGYKASRKGMPDELAVQLPMLKKLLSAMKIRVCELAGYEADDVIGTLSKRFKVQTYIVTGDRDSLQLIDDTTTVLLTKRGITEIAEVDEAALKRDFGLTPAQVVDYKALAGDSSDCIPGVGGVGDKTALGLLGVYGSLDAIYLELGSVKGKLRERLEAGRDMAYLSRELATIEINVPLSETLEDCRVLLPFDNCVREEFGRLNFKTLYKRDELFGQRIERRELPESVPVTLNELSINGDAAILFDDKLYVGGEDYSREVTLAADLLGRGESVENCVARLSDYFKSDFEKTVFDLKPLIKLLGFEPSRCFDVKLAQYLIDMSVDYSSPKALTERYGYELSGCGVYKVGLVQRCKLKELDMESLYYDLELPLAGVLERMERHGFKVDTAKLGQLNREYYKRLDDLTAGIYALAGRSFNINSPKQLGQVLFGELKLPYAKKSKSYSTAAEILEPLAADYEIAALVLKYRTINKLNGGYVEGLKKMIDNGGVVHTEFKQTLTTTGRLSSTEPNLQNIPVREEEGRALREIFVAGEGRTLVSADYSQIELRLMAHLSGDEKLIEAYRAGEDIHTSTAAEVFGVPLEEVTPKMRREAKAVNFGIIYGISDFGLAQNLRIPRKTAADYIQRYFDRFPGVKRYLDESIEKARACGYAVTIMGRIRRIPEIHSPNYTTRSFGERVAMNMPLQGSAADIIKAAMLAADKRLRGTSSSLILQVHDELIVEAADGEVEMVKTILRECMQNAASLKVPLEVSVGTGKNWLECE